MINTPVGKRTERKKMITVAEWTGAAHDVYTLVTSQPSPFDPTQYYKIVAGQYVAGSSGDTWAANTWYSKTSSTLYREILGTRTEDSSIELNPDIETTTDVLGITYTDVNKTEPQQTFDPFNLIGGSYLGEYLSAALAENNINAWNAGFDVYIIFAFEDSGVTPAHAYKAVKHSQCSIIPTSLGGSNWLSMPIEIHYSNNITSGTVDKLSSDFTFTAA